MLGRLLGATVGKIPTEMEIGAHVRMVVSRWAKHLIQKTCIVKIGLGGRFEKGERGREGNESEVFSWSHKVDGTSHLPARGEWVQEDEEVALRSWSGRRQRVQLDGWHWRSLWVSRWRSLVFQLRIVVIFVFLFLLSANRTRIFLKEVKLPVKISAFVCLDCGQSRSPMARAQNMENKWCFWQSGTAPSCSVGADAWREGPEQKVLGEDEGKGEGKRIISKKKSLLFLILHTWGS